MRDPRRLATQARALAEVSRAAARAHGCHPLRAAALARRVRRRQGFEYGEALRAGVLDPAMPEAVRVEHVSRNANLASLAPLNGGNEVPALTGDKAAFYRYCAALDIRVPRLLGILDTRGAGWSASGRVLVDAADRAAFVADDLPERFVVKPADGYGGKGVRVVDRRRDGLLAYGGRDGITVAELAAELAADPEFDLWVVQEHLVNHATLVEMAGAATLHSVRIATLVGRAGVPELLFAFLKLGFSGVGADNFLAGTTGNGLVPVELEGGRLGRAVVPDVGAAGYRRLPESPATGARIEGVVLPDWAEACRLALDAAPHFLPTRSLGWDVALTPGGPVLVEANTRWLPLPGPAMGPVHRRVRAAGAGTARRGGSERSR